MKKFLTVLLALSVVFTYSFSSVGAVFADATVDTELTEAQKDVYEAVVGTNQTLLKGKFDAAWKKVDDQIVKDNNSPSQYTITKKAYASLEDKAFKVIDEAVRSLVKRSDFGTVASVNGWLDTDGNIMEQINKDLNSELAQAQFAIDYAKEIAKLDTVDLTAYSTKQYDDEFTHREKAKDIIDTTKEKAKEIADGIDTESTLTESVTAFLAIDAIVSAYYKTDKSSAAVKEITVEVEGNDVGTGVYEIADPKVKKVTNDAVDEADKAAKKAAVLQKVAEYKAAQASAGEAIDETLVAAYTERYYTFIDEGVTYGVAPDYAPATVSSFETSKLVYNYKLLEGLVAFGEKYKAEKDAEGNIVRDAAAIDEIVAKAKLDVYLADHTVGQNGIVTTAENKIVAETLVYTNAGLAYAKQTAKTMVAAWVEENADEYYPAELAEIETIVAEFNAKIDAEKTAAKVEALYNTYQAKLDAVLTDDEVNDDIDGKAAFTAAKTALLAQAKLYNGALADADKATKTLDVNDDVLTAVLCEFYGEKGARTEVELKALKGEIASLIANLPTAGAQATAKTAAKAAIDALPATITLADEAAVQEAVDALEAYRDLFGTGLTTEEGTLDSARAKLTAAYKLDLTQKVNAVDLKDKAALKALKAEFEAAKDKNGGCLTADVTAMAGYATIKDALDKIKTTEFEAVKKAILALPVNVTLADKAQIEAARALYDAYVEEYTSYDAFGKNAVEEFANPVNYYRDLALAEAALSILEKDAAIKAVREFQISTTTQLVKGKKMIVKWNVIKGDESAIDGYRVYYSTKKSNAGFKVLADVKGKKLNHTSIKKTVKKGTRVYYRVKAYKMIDGLRYLSAYSSAGHRTWK